jgi:hypothetical protein
MSALQINGIALVPIEYSGERVVTLAMIDQVHQRPDGTARSNFAEHRARLVEGEDFIELTADELRTQSLGTVLPPRTGKAMLITESGYLMLVKSFTDDLAWDVQRLLVKTYFTRPAPAADPLASLPAEHRALIALMCENAAIKAEQAAQAAALAAQGDAIKRIESNQIAAVASVQSFTAMGYSNYRDLQLSKIELTRLGRKASAISKKRGITVDHVSDSRYGRVGSYHITVLDDAVEELSK